MASMENLKQFIKEYVEARGGKDALTEDEKRRWPNWRRKKLGNTD